MKKLGIESHKNEILHIEKSEKNKYPDSNNRMGCKIEGELKLLLSDSEFECNEMPSHSERELSMKVTTDYIIKIIKSLTYIKSQTNKKKCNKVDSYPVSVRFQVAEVPLQIDYNSTCSRHRHHSIIQILCLEWAEN